MIEGIDDLAAETARPFSGCLSLLENMVARDSLLAFENMFTRPYELQGIVRHSVKQNLIVKMRTGAAAGVSQKTDLVPKADLLPVFNEYLVQVTIARADAQAVVDLDHLAVPTLPAHKGYYPGSGTQHRRFPVGGQIDATVHRPLLGEGVASLAVGCVWCVSLLDQL